MPKSEQTIGTPRCPGKPYNRPAKSENKSIPTTCEPPPVHIPPRFKLADLAEPNPNRIQYPSGTRRHRSPSPDSGKPQKAQATPDGRPATDNGIAPLTVVGLASIICRSHSPSDDSPPKLPTAEPVGFKSPSGSRRSRSPLEGNPPKIAAKPYDRPIPNGKKESIRWRYNKPFTAHRITDKAQLNGFDSIPIREKSNQIRKEVNRRSFASFETALKADNKLPTEEGYDDRYDIPLLKERVELGQILGLPKSIRTDKFLSIEETLGLDAPTVRKELDKYATPCWDALDNSSWCRKDWTKARHGQVTIKGVPMDTPMPTHIAQAITTSDHEGGQTIITPVHSAFLRASWSRLGGLPEYDPMDICTPVIPNGRKCKPEWEFARGELPFVRMKIDNIATFGHLLAYTYFRNDEALIRSLLGPLAEDLTNFVGQKMNMKQRQCEWTMSRNMAEEYTYPVLYEHAWFIHDLAENANTVGMEGTRFWWVLDACMRVIIDAIIAQKRFEPDFFSDTSDDDTDSSPSDISN